MALVEVLQLCNLVGSLGTYKSISFRQRAQSPGNGGAISKNFATEL